MLVGYAPFCSKETSEVCYKVLNWKKYLKIPSKIKISKEAEDLIKKLINNSNERLGLRGSEEIKSHPFFKGIDWDNIRNTKAPFIPKLKNDYDNSYFETYKIEEPFYPPMKKRRKRKDVEYMGYTYKEDSYNDTTLSNEFENSIKAITFINQYKSNGDSLDTSNMENGGKNNIYNGLGKKINSISINIEDNFTNSVNNNDIKILLKTKKINIKNNNYRKTDDKNEDKVNEIKKIGISNTISYNSTKKIKKKKKLKKKININNNNNNPGMNNSKIFFTDKNKKIVKIRLINSNSNQSPNCINKNEISNELNKSNDNNNIKKSNVIQLPTKKIKEKTNKKIIFPENGASVFSATGKYIFKKNMVISSSNSNNNRYIPFKLSPQPRDNILKRLIISKNKIRKNNGIKRITSKSSERNIIPKPPLKGGIINQNAIKKKYIGLNSAKSIFLNKIKNTLNNYNNNNMNNFNNCSYNGIYHNCITERGNTKNIISPYDKISYIYQKKF